jgi:hypothetical protein
VRVMAVEPATTRCHDRVVYLIVSLCKDYGDYMCEQYVLLCEYYEFLLIYVFWVIAIYYFCCTSCFGVAPFGEAAKIGVVLK